MRDPYVFDHLGLTGRVHERDMEQALMDKLQDTLLEFGHGMAFVGRQVRFTVNGDDLVIDLLLFHVDQLRYVVVELKIGQFESGHVGQLGTYVALVDDRLCKPDRHAHTVGILLVAGRNEAIVRYALAGAPAPLAVANYTYDSLPPQRAGRTPPGQRARRHPRRRGRPRSPQTDATDHIGILFGDVQHRVFSRSMGP